MRDLTPGVAVDSFGLLTCLAARILKVPLVSVLQGNFPPASDGFLRWQGQRPVGLPSAAPIMNKVAAEYGIAPVASCARICLAGNLSLIVGTPETDPLPASASVGYIAPIVWQRGNATVPDWVTALSGDQLVIWVDLMNTSVTGAAAVCAPAPASKN